MLDIETLDKQIMHCSDCCLRQTCRCPVPGSGPIDSPLMIVGEAPGGNEDADGIPFVGRCGKYLRRKIEEHISVIPYYTNAAKCRPPDNRAPTPEELIACSHWITREIDYVRPKVILTLGKWAAYSVVGVKKSKLMKDLVGEWWHAQWKHDTIIPVRITYHPSFLTQHGRRFEKQFERDLDEVDKLLMELRK